MKIHGDARLTGELYKVSNIEQHLLFIKKEGHNDYKRHKWLFYWSLIWSQIYYKLLKLIVVYFYQLKNIINIFYYTINGGGIITAGTSHEPWRNIFFWFVTNIRLLSKFKVAQKKLSLWAFIRKYWMETD